MQLPRRLPKRLYRTPSSNAFGYDLCLLDDHLVAMLIVGVMVLLPLLIAAMTTATISLVHAEIYFGGRLCIGL
jgi:hypothetical protein